jgi:putative phage-type endonuclease
MIDFHRSRIGASMAPAVLAVSPYKDQNPLGAYLFFTGASDGVEETEDMAWGTMIEEAIRDAARAHFQAAVSVAMPRLHPQHPFMGASPDGVVYVMGERRGLELKNVTDAARAREWGEPGTDQVPTHVMVQVQQQAAVFGFDVVEVAVSLFGRPPVFYSVPRDEAIISRIIKVEAEFWLRVQERRPPDPDWTHPDTPRLVEMLHRPEKGKEIGLGFQAMALADLYGDWSGEMSGAKKQKDKFRGQLIELLGDAEIGLLPDGRRVRRRLVPACEPKMSKGRKEYFVLEILKGEHGQHQIHDGSVPGDDSERLAGDEDGQ